jgi:hypothetical protein
VKSIGYSRVHAFILHVFNVDINYVVTSAAVIWLFTTLASIAWGSLLYVVQEYFMSSITIDKSELLLWKIQQTCLSKHEDELKVRYLNAARKPREWNTTEPETVDENGWLNFSCEEASRDTMFTPSIGRHRTRLNGRIFYLVNIGPRLQDQTGQAPGLKKFSAMEYRIHQKADSGNEGLVLSRSHQKENDGH